MLQLALSLLLIAAPPPADGPELIVQTTQDRGFAAVATSADGRLLAAPVDYQGILRVWDLGSGLQVKVRRLPTDASGVAFLPDGRLALAGTDSTVSLFAPTSDAPPVVLQGRLPGGASVTNYRAAVAASADGLVAAGGFEGTLEGARTLIDSGSDAGRQDLKIVQADALHPVVRVWRDGALLATLTFPEGERPHVTSLAFSPDGRRLVAGTSDAGAVCWHLTKPSPAWSVAEDDALGDVSVDFAPNGRVVAVARGKRLAIHDAATGRVRASWDAPAELRRVRFVTPKRLLTTSADGRVRVWTAGHPEPRLARLEPGPFGDIARVGTSNVFAFTHGRGIVLWDAAHDTLVRAMQRTPTIAHAAWADAQRSLLVATDGHLRTWGTTTDASSPGLTLPDPVVALRNSVNGAFVALRTQGEAPSLAVVEGTAPTLRWTVPAAGASSLDVSPDGALVGVLVDRRAVSVHDSATGAVRARIPVVSAAIDVVFGMAFEARRGPEPTFVTIGRAAAGGYEIQRWGVTSGTATRVATMQSRGPMTELVASPIGPHLAASFPEGNAVAVIDLATGRAHDVPTNGVVLRFSPVEPLLAIGTSAGEVVLWDADRGRELRRFTLTPTFIDELSFTRDGTMLVAGGRDGSVSLLSLRQHLATGFFSADTRLIVTPDGFYLGDLGALSQVAVRIGDRAYPFEQLDLQLHRPEHVLARLGADPGLVAMVEQVTERRRQRAGVAADAHGTPPTLALRGARPPVSTARRELRLNVEVRAGSHELARLEVFVNDVPSFGRAGRPLRAAARDGKASARVAVSLAPGRNRVQLVARDAVGLASARETFEVQCTAREQPRDLYVVAVGVSRFTDPRMDLDYAAKDAVDIARILRRQAGAYRAVKVALLLDAEAAAAHVPRDGESVAVATRANLLALQQDLRGARQDDELIVFISGHGTLDAAMQYRVPTTDFDFAQPGTGGVTFDELEELLDGVAARHKLLLLDTCHAGELDPADLQRRAPSEAGVVVRTFVGAKSAVGGRALAPAARTTLVEDLFVELRRGSGATVIAATRGAELAFEADRWNNGAFTLALREALECGRAAGPDGAVHLRDLWSYVATRVPALTDGLQRPVTRRRNLAQDERVVARPPFAAPAVCDPRAVGDP